MRLLWTFVFCALALASSSYASSLSPTVMTLNGPVVGTQENGYFVWKGIPFATVQRWQPPAPVASWTEPKPAQTFGPCCPQPPSNFFANQKDLDSRMDEDCLSLNIWSPQNAQDSPVLIYIHGGGYVSGCSDRGRYHGLFMANTTNTVVVTINYRLGMFGFLAGSDKPSANTTANSISGNFGILDQQAAIKWVHDNIKAFGGNPKKVTISGQSAGGISVATHLTMPASPHRSYFSAAIIQSNPTLMEFRDMAAQQPQFDIVSSALDCGFATSRIECMKALPWQTLLEKQDWAGLALIKNNTWRNVIHKLVWSPTVDGKLITMAPTKAFASGNFYHIPTMIGIVSNETGGFLSLAFGNGPMTPIIAGAFYISGLDTLFGKPTAQLVRNLYPANDEHLMTYDLSNVNISPAQSAMMKSFIQGTTTRGFELAVSRVLTDFAFICSVLRSAEQISRYQPTYVYQFAHPPGCDPNNAGDPICSGRVCHSAEVDFVFHSIAYDRRGDCSWTPEEENLSWQMLHYWTSFAAQDGSINIKWPKYSGNNVLKLDIPISITSSLKNQSNCNFWYDVMDGRH